MIGSILKGTAKAIGFGFGNPAGRILAGGAVGGAYHSATGTEGNAGDRFIFGAMTGAAIGAGVSVGAGMLSSKNFWKAAGKGAVRTARNMPSYARSAVRTTGNIAAAATNPYMLAAAAGTAAVGGSAYIYSNTTQQERVGRHQQGMYTQRLQRSTYGMVQGMHNGRHR